MTIKLSNSSLNKYVECPRSYALHYIDKLRSIAEPSPLTFGSAMDKAFTAMLIPGDKTPEEVFLEEWSPEKILTPNFKWNKSDIDDELVSDIDFGSDANNPEAMYAFHSLERKGILMLNALREKVMPNIEHVYSVQEPIKLANQDSSGDEFIGYIDFVVKWKGYDKPIIFDLKTATVPYKADSVRTSQQLTIYSYAAGDKYKTNLAGYVVLAKKIRKNRTKKCCECGAEFFNSRLKTCSMEEPVETCEDTTPGMKLYRCNGELKESVKFDVDVQIIIDEIPEQGSDSVLELIDNTHANIRAENFEQNTSSCTHPIFRTQCPYYNYCWNNQSMIGLVKKEDK